MKTEFITEKGKNDGCEDGPRGHAGGADAGMVDLRRRKMLVKAAKEQLGDLTELACRLWPEHSPGELRVEIGERLCREDACFFLKYEGMQAIAFAQCQLRRDYVEGTETSPVGYLEGIYVREDFRRRGVARELLAACEQWARKQGCREFASDCELTNRESERFHRALGFGEAGRIICFVKKLLREEIEV